MGYGIGEEFFTGASFDNNRLYFFTEAFNQQQVDSLKEEQEVYKQRKKKLLEI